MKKTCLATWATVVVVALSSPAASQAPAADAAWQAAIDRAVRSEGDEARRSALDALGSRAENRPEEFVRQLFVYSESADSTRGAMAFGALVAALHVSDRAVQRALVPLLEEGDEAFRAKVGGYLSEFEHRSVDYPTDLAVYRDFLAPAMRGDAPLPAGLVRYLFEVEPGSALLVLARLAEPGREELRSVLWAEHEVRGFLWKAQRGFASAPDPAVLAELAESARSERWWARLYAARILTGPGRAAGLADAESLARLARDEHPLVAETARR